GAPSRRARGRRSAAPRCSPDPHARPPLSVRMRRWLSPVFSSALLISPVAAQAFAPARHVLPVTPQTVEPGFAILTPDEAGFGGVILHSAVTEEGCPCLA